MSASPNTSSTPPTVEQPTLTYNGTPYRCRACKTLLAVLTDNGYEIQARRVPIAIVTHGTLCCRNCGLTHRVSVPDTQSAGGKLRVKQAPALTVTTKADPQ